MTEALPTPETKTEAKPTAYVEKLVIDGFRGMHTTIEGFAPLTILVGRNGTRKSTVLEALLLAAAPVPAMAVRDLLAARRGVLNPARWLFPRGETAMSVSTKLQSGAFARTGRIEWSPVNPATQALGRDAKEGAIGLALSASYGGANGQLPERDTWLAVGPHGDDYRISLGPGREPKLPFEVSLMRPGATPAADLADRYTRLKTLGRRREAESVLATIGDRVAMGRSLEIGSESGSAFLMLADDSSAVPVALLGDGAREMIEAAVHYGLKSNGLQLHEEPELHLHPGAIREMARVIADAVKRGVQVVLTTHSLELIDALLAQMSDALEHVAVMRTALAAGQLQIKRVPGPAAAELRHELDEDLR